MKTKPSEPPGGNRKKRKRHKSLNPPQNQILGFQKSSHFIKMQKVRKIDDAFLARILWHQKPTARPTSIVVKQSEIKKLSAQGKVDPIYRHCNRDLVIVIDGKELITCFQSDYNAYCTSTSIINLQFFFNY